MGTIPNGAGHNSVEHQTLEVFRELLSELGSPEAAENLTLNSLLDRDLGLGSLERVELLVRVESRFRTRLADEIAQQAETPSDWVKAVRKGAQARPEAPKENYRIVQPTREAPPPPDSALTLIEVLRRQAEIEPDRVHIHLLEEDSGEDISFRQLFERASRVASALHARGLRPNETAAIMLPTGADFFYAYFGIALAGGIPVPIYPPARPNQVEEYVRRQVGILRNAEVRFLISFDRVKAVADIMRVSIPSLISATTVAALVDGATPGAPAVEPADIAMLQYTSGSTGDPKGVVLTHDNLLANIRGIGWAVKVRPTDIGVSWLPLYHDMGLIGSWLFCLYYAIPITILSPLAFLSRPERWLWALSDSNGTLCPAPNFAYELCARKIPDSSLEEAEGRGRLDLSPWRIAINAGEPVLPGTLAHFAERFHKFGFRAESFVPCYGLAESSVALAFPPIDRRPVIDSIRRQEFQAEAKAIPVPQTRDHPTAIQFVANGRPLPGHEIRIVDEEGDLVDERTQGQLFFRGPSMTSGYYRNPKATAAIMTEDGWLDSGDLAYWANGEVFVTGRRKDCIIKSGRNIIPQEVEAATADVAGVRRGCIAALGSVDAATGTERLVVVAETRATARNEIQRLEAAVVKSVGDRLGIPPDKVVLVPPHSIPKTSSGKIRRNETRILYESGRLRAGKRPPWVQLLRLWLGNLGNWLRLKARHAGTLIRRAYLGTALRATAAISGFLIRLMPGKKAAARFTQWSARLALALTGQSVKVMGTDAIPQGKPSVFVANSASALDLLVLAASLPKPFLIADSTALARAPREVRFLFKRLVVPAVKRNRAADGPPGGTLRDRVREALGSGFTIVAFADGPPGTPPEASRYRLDAIDAAARTSAPIVPIGLCGTEGVFASHRYVRRPTDSHAEVRVGGVIHAQMNGHHALTESRQRIREAIVKLCQKED
jgi:acyl-CoA synthetase (AMP-forming)/AMP-acid ligase II/1-acyl-sn-glycerol-3-phosphate acyltransferase/acyl carrier protein